jgi:hypothetical protein
MRRAFASEWIKLRRRSMIIGALGATVAFATLGTGLSIARATQSGAGGHGPLGGGLSVAALSRSDGLAQAFGKSSELLGIVALCVFAASFAAEYSEGTLRNLLLREPRRLRLLTGKYLALAALISLAVVAAGAVSVVTALAIAPSHGIDTSAWITADGLRALSNAVGNTAAASVGYGTLGAALALALRSPAAAIGTGVAYVLPVEAIIKGTVSGADRWLPGQLLAALASGGTDAVSYTTAGGVLVACGAVVVTMSALVFQRQDVTA